MLPDVFTKPSIPLSATAVHVKVAFSVTLPIVTDSVVSPVNINWSSKDVTFVVGLTVMVKVCEADVHVTSLFSKVG